jgi:hypothetical protein
MAGVSKAQAEFGVADGTSLGVFMRTKAAEDQLQPLCLLCLCLLCLGRDLQKARRGAEEERLRAARVAHQVQQVPARE